MRFSLTRPAGTCPDEPAYLELTFEGGVPVAVNGIAMPLVGADSQRRRPSRACTAWAASTWWRTGWSGIKSREVYEAPAAVVLHAAYRELETIVIPKDLLRLKRELGTRYADLVYNGLWFTPTREAIDAFVATIQPQGDRRGSPAPVQGRAPRRRPPVAVRALRSLARHLRRRRRFDHTAAEGFIKLWGLPVETVARQAAKVAARQPAAPSPATDFAPIPSNGKGVAAAGHGRSAIVADWVGLYNERRSEK